MPHETLTNQTQHAASVARLQQTYDLGLIPPEKKPFLIDLRRAYGPFLAVENGGLICDGASQIASLGLGFNASALFGAAQHLESWTNQTQTEHFQSVRSAFQDLLRRKLGSDRFAAHFCASGAEAVESTLAHFYDRRQNDSQRRVLAFEGSFHGRMMVALASTWNPKKREPFAWPGHDSIFSPYPEMESDEITAPQIPDWWQDVWCEKDDAKFKSRVSSLGSDDPLLAKEIESLKSVRQHLADQSVFAILIEPMQCEGGDRYSSTRFHQGLAYLSSTYNIPLVYDEIQTGFGLGGEFFWHRFFPSVNPDGSPFFPAGVICAKKAQTGISLTYRDSGSDLEDCPHVEQISAASLIRGYIQAAVVDQFRSAAEKIEAINRDELAKAVRTFGDHISRPRGRGLCFAFDFASPDVVSTFVGNRFHHGLLYYPAGSKTARFRFNLGYRPRQIQLFWEQLHAALSHTFHSNGAASESPIRIDVPSPARHFEFHEAYLDRRLASLNSATPHSEDGNHDAISFVESHCRQLFPDEPLTATLVDKSNYAEFRERILAVQNEVYEPARQSPPEEFDELFESDNPLAMIVHNGDRIVAMTFAGPLSLFHQQRGVPEDPQVDNPNVVYMLDLTVTEPYRGQMGGLMKQGLMMLAQSQGVEAIHGRNRDRLAAGMWAINLGLGSFETKHLFDDYPDDHEFRDCIYYRCPTNWNEPTINLGSAIESPLGYPQLDSQFIRDHLPVLVNKMTLSNFVTERFLSQLEDVAQKFPEPLRHMYTANGLSECVDKIVKVLWKHRQPRTRLLTIAGHDFGHGSFLSRSLSGIGKPRFDVVHLPDPAKDESAFFTQLESQLQSDEILGMLIEPLQRRTMTALAEDTVRRIVETCRSHSTPLLYNETASLFYRYSQDSFTASGVAGLQPDATIAYFGGQMAAVNCTSELFLADPLLLISTWEGDAFSLGQFHRAMQLVEENKADYLATVADFQSKLEQQTGAQLHNGCGLLASPPTELQPLLREAGPDRWTACASYSEMKRYLASQS